jgi:hypothetical protein
MEQKHQQLFMAIPNEKFSAIAGSLQNQFASHDLCDEHHERRVETRAQAVLASVDDTPLDKVRPNDMHKLANSLKLRTGCGLDGIPNNCLRSSKMTTGTLEHLITSFGSSIFQSPGRKQKL